MRPIEDYFGPYGTLSQLRGHNLRSFFERVRASFDLPNTERAQRELAPFIGTDGTYECAYCGLRAEEWDHIEEASKGGSHQIGNLLPACRSCNRRKRPWLDQLNKVAGSEFESRKRRIEEYISKLQSPGHSIFDEHTLPKFKKAEQDFFDALKNVDEVILEATKRFHERNPK